jgi:DNA-binding transcriptional regulator YdaS (Cro superfamily)
MFIVQSLTREVHMQSQVLEKVRKHYAKALGRERGAMAEFARNMGQDPRLVNAWERIRGAIPAYYGPEVERVTSGAVKASEVVAEDLAYVRGRKDAMIARRRRVVVK